MRPFLLSVGVSLLSSCGYQLTGPQPTANSLSPQLVCNDQLLTTVTLSGDMLRPLPNDVLTEGGEPGPSLELPSVQITRQLALDGSADVGDAVDLTAFDLDDERTLVRWLNESTIELDVTPEHALAAGVYDLLLTNPDGQSDGLPGSLALAPPPQLIGLAPEILCVDDMSVIVELTGETFLGVDGALPTVDFGGVVVTADSLSDCIDLAGPVPGQICSTLTATLPQGSLTPGVYAATVTNPEATGCVSTEVVEFEVVAEPTLDAVAPDPTCLAETGRTFTATGSDFLVLDDGTLPDVTIGAETVAADAAASCTDLQGPAGGQVCDELTFSVDIDGVAAGVQPVSVQNPEPAACTSDEVDIDVVPPPTVAAIDAPLTCNAQGDDSFALTGTGFVTIAGTLPTVHLGAFSVVATSADGCTALGSPLGAETCTELTVDVPAGSLTDGLLDVSVTNPPDADCTSMDSVSLEVVPAPTVTEVRPSEVCDAHGDIGVTIVGTGFVDADGALPSVTIGGLTFPADAVGDCTALTGTLPGFVCNEVDISVPAGSYTTVGAEAVAVANPAPADCATGEAVDWNIVPPPSIASAAPALTCQGASIVLDGADFSASTSVVIGGELASVTVDDSTTITAAVPLGLPVGTPLDVSVEAPGQCIDTLAGALTLTDPPTLTDVVEALTCGEQVDTTFVLTGTDFLFVGGSPTVELGGAAVTATSPTGCTAVTGGQSCTGLTAVFPAGTLDALAPGLQPILVRNPAPADCTTNTLDVEVLPPPTLAALVPPEQCWDIGDFSVTVQGDGFLRTAGGALPTVDIGGETFVASSAASCSSLTGPEGGEICTELTIDVPAATWDAAQTLPASVINPDPAACASDDAVSLDLYDPPRVTAVEPPKVCEGDQDVIIRGTGFRDTPDVEFIGPGGTHAAQSVTFVSDTELVATLPVTMLPGDYDVHVTNPDGCDDLSNPGELIVVEPPIVIFVDPPTMYSGIPIQATIYVSGVNDGVAEVYIEEVATGAITNIDPVDFTWDDADPLRVQALIPAGLARGDYNIWVVDDVGCTVGLEDAFFVEDTPTVSVTSVDPPFGWEGESTPVLVEGNGTVVGNDGFLDLPRVYLSPDSPGPSTAATELRGVVWQDEQTIDAIVPPLSADLYDLIVVNPDGTVGFLDDAYNSVAQAPPRISSLAPGSIARSTGQLVTVVGDRFDTATPPTVDLECVDPTVGGTPTVYTAPEVQVTGNTAAEIDLLIDGSIMSNGVCIVVVNHADGTYDRFAALSVVNPSANLYDWRATTSMQEARRAPMATTGRVTRTQRFLYVFGGDDGDPANAKDTWEKNQVGIYGDLGPNWSYNFRDNGNGVQNQQFLPGTLTQAAVAQIGRFVYLVGGNDGSGPVANVWRAQILDPLEAPRITDIELDLGTGAELDGGEYSYRVSAVFDGSDVNNPGGETLASDPLTVRLPSISDRLVLDLTWSQVPRAVGYRIYRSPTADQGSKSEVLLAEVVGGTTTTWTDDDSETPDPTILPHETAALGEWAALPNLGALRDMPSAAVAQDPADPDTWYLYAAGGTDGTNIWDDVEVLPITINSEHDHSVGAWSDAGVTMGGANFGGSAWTVDDRLHTVQAPGTSWVYFGAGQDGFTGGQRFNDVVEGGEVQAGGTLGSWAAATDLQPERVGAGVLSASNYLYVFGGQKGTPSAGGVSTEVTGPAATGNWNSLGTSMSESRVWMGSAQESSIVFAIGGETDSAAASATVDFTNF